MKASKHTKKKLIMAIDDSRMILTFLEAYLEKEYDVVTYTSSSTALEDVASCNVMPDMVLIDYNMPGELNGLEVINKLKDIDPQIPVLVLSGSCSMTEKINCLRSGAIDFVNKPFNPGELQARILNAFAIVPSLNAYRHAV